MKSTRRRHGASGPRKAESHVRLYAHELAAPAYRTLSVDARALLVELRSLYTGGPNRVFLGIRQMMERLGIGQRRAQAARDELFERGWIVEIEPGGFNRKTRHATVYALTNEPIDDYPGSVAPKQYMRWMPQKNDGSCDDY